MAIGYSLRMCARHVDSTNPGRSNLVFRSKPIAEAEMSIRLISVTVNYLKDIAIVHASRPMLGSIDLTTDEAQQNAKSSSNVVVERVTYHLHSPPHSLPPPPHSPFHRHSRHRLIVHLHVTMVTGRSDDVIEKYSEGLTLEKPIESTLQQMFNRHRNNSTLLLFLLLLLPSLLLLHLLHLLLYSSSYLHQAMSLTSSSLWVFVVGSGGCPGHH